MHGQEVVGMRLKVLPADPQEPNGSLSTSPSGGPGGDQKCKRPKMDLMEDPNIH